VYAIPETYRKNVNGFEINPVTAGIAKIFHQDMNVRTDSFESLFMDKKGHKKEFVADYDLAIGNPPYGDPRGFYKGLGEESKISRYEIYFMKRSLDLLKEGGTLAMVVPSGFLRGTESLGGKTGIASMGKLVEAWRLPNGAFDSTDVGTDIVIFQKKTGLAPEGSLDNRSRTEELSNDAYFIANPNNVLGTPTMKKGRFGMEAYVEIGRAHV
jgi:type I restriction-modification system DNA methylase subunit